MIQALHDNIIIRVVHESKSKGGIYVPESARKFKLYDGQYYGVVVSVGPKCPYKEIKPGDKIYYVQNEGKKFIYEGEEYFQLGTKKPRDWVLAKLED
jgi:co-chaperonin GroES (HSP10)